MTHIKTNTIQEFCFLCRRNPSWLVREFLVPIKAEGLLFLWHLAFASFGAENAYVLLQ